MTKDRPDSCVFHANGKKYVPLDFHNYFIREIIKSFEEEIMESKTTQQVKAADVANSVGSALTHPATKFIVIRPERGDGGKFDNVEVSIVTEGQQPTAPAPAPAPQK